MKKEQRRRAKEWNAEQEKAAFDARYFEDLKFKFYYVAVKGENMPCTHTLEQHGFHEAAAKVRQAETLLEEAYYMIERNS